MSAEETLEVVPQPRDIEADFRRIRLKLSQLAHKNARSEVIKAHDNLIVRTAELKTLLSVMIGEQVPLSGTFTTTSSRVPAGWVMTSSREVAGDGEMSHGMSVLPPDMYTICEIMYDTVSVAYPGFEATHMMHVTLDSLQIADPAEVAVTRHNRATDIAVSQAYGQPL